MLKIKRFTFNDFQVNTYLLYDNTKECVIVDAACYHEHEQQEIVKFIADNDLIPVGIYQTHSHVDHILGATFLCKKYHIGVAIHHEGQVFHDNAPMMAEMFGFKLDPMDYPISYFNDGDVITFGESKLHVIYTPGHANGSVCFHNLDQQFVMVGDVLFMGSIGRTDLPTGNYHTLIDSISKRLLPLDENTKVYSGHGPVTTIGFEKNNNPFLK